MNVEQFRQHVTANILAAKEDQRLTPNEISGKTASMDEFVSPASVRRVLAGEPVKIDTVLAVADALGVSYDSDEADEVLQLEVEHLHKTLVSAYDRLVSQDTQIESMRQLIRSLDHRANRIAVSRIIEAATTGTTLLLVGVLALAGRVSIGKQH